MNIIRIDHVSLDVDDRAHSLDWYAQVLGLAVVPDPATPPDQPIFLGPLGARLGLFAERKPGLRHIALATDPAGQESVASRLDRAGIRYVPERHSDHESIYFADPDGIMLEVMVPAFSN
jgi:catechol 2,3-dioxygenase-like lactoylglutathione lyase family enzyme